MNTRTMPPSTKRTSFQYKGEELNTLTDAHNDHNWILRVFAPYFGERVIEVGAGLGAFSRMLVEVAGVPELLTVDPADNLFPTLESEYRRTPQVKTIHGYLENIAPSLSADSVVMVNVLEHVKNDERLLNTIYQVLVPGGRSLFSCRRFLGSTEHWMRSSNIFDYIPKLH